MLLSISSTLVGAVRARLLWKPLITWNRLVSYKLLN